MVIDVHVQEEECENTYINIVVATKRQQYKLVLFILKTSSM